MRAYSTDLKERLVRAVADGQPMREAARRFGVAVTTVKRAVVQQRETGSLERKPIPGCPRRIGKDQEASLRARLEAAPDATVRRALWVVGTAARPTAQRDNDVAGDPSAGLDA
jgi:transposase